MIKIGLVFAFLFAISSQTNAQKEVHHTSDTIPVYLPLQLGNKWQYLEVSQPGFSVASYSLSFAEVESDTLINNLLYYRLSDFGDLVRYSVIEKKIYVYSNETDGVYIDFSIPDGTYYQSFFMGQYRTVSSDAGSVNIFNLNRIYGGYLYIPGSWGYNVNYTDSIGLNYDRSAGDHFDNSRYLIQSVLYDSSGTEKHFTLHHKPIFVIQPLNIIDSSTFYLPFMINHVYTKTVSGYPNSGLDFIDSVKMFSYYSKNDSIVFNPSIIPLHTLTPVNVNYLVTTQLDTSLLKDGFTFNYRFTAKDKGIIPEYASAPDSGYYQCLWDETSSIQQYDNKLPNSFLLSQNYPNPFNPSTKISWQSPVGGWQTLKVYDILGNEVATLVNEYRNAGSYEVEFNSASSIKNLASGIYFYRLQAGDYVETKKMILLK